MFFNLTTIKVLIVVKLLFVIACSGEKVATIYVGHADIPIMSTDSVTTLISDSGITRYKLVAPKWDIFDAPKDYWHFPNTILVERFDSVFNVEASLQSDTAWHFTDQKLWKFVGKVKFVSLNGAVLDTEELFWNQDRGIIYSEQYFVCRRGEELLQGYGFESDENLDDIYIKKIVNSEVLLPED